MFSQYRNGDRIADNYLCCGILCSLVLLSAIPTLTFAQGTERKIVSDDFTRHRHEAATTTAYPQAKPGTANPKRSQAQAASVTRPTSGTQPALPRRTYHLASAPARRPATKLALEAQLGITIWKLRPAQSGDTGARLLVREKGRSSEWVPARVEGDATFREGDHVRLSIESPRDGYLYVVDRDLFTDGTTGPAMLIYPWAEMRRGDNQVSPGTLVDIPAQEDDPSYFTARPTSPNQVGEILTVIVTSSPLDLPISDKPFEISKGEIARWEKSWGGYSERFEMEGGAGAAWTREEQQSSARKGSRQLTREDPAPQTIYRITTADNKALLVNVRLRYAK